MSNRFANYLQKKLYGNDNNATSRNGPVRHFKSDHLIYLYAKMPTFVYFEKKLDSIDLL